MVVGNKMSKLCECGCGQIVKNRFVSGHNITRDRYSWKGKHLFEEHKRSISVALAGESGYWFGKYHTEDTKKKIIIAKIGVPLTEETRHKITTVMRSKYSGVNNYMYGKIPSNAYKKGQSPPLNAGRGKGSYCKKGHWVRSSWELFVADWLFDHNIPYEYEFKRFHFGRWSYLPDFYVSSLDLWIEVKGWMDPKSRLQIRLFIDTGNKLLILDDLKLFEKMLKKLKKFIEDGKYKKLL